MPELLPASDREELPVASLRLYIVVLERNGWTKRLFLGGWNSAGAQAELARALQAIAALDEPQTTWPDYISHATCILRQAGFVRTAH